MTYGYEMEPLANTTSRLGANLPRPIVDMVHKYAKGLPITAGHVLQTGQRTFRVFWVSGTSLVFLDTGEVEHGAMGFVVNGGGWVRSLQLAAIDLEAISSQAPAPTRDWDTFRRVTVTLKDGSESLVFPQPDYPLDNQDNRDALDAFLDALLQGIAVASQQETAT